MKNYLLAIIFILLGVVLVNQSRGATRGEKLLISWTAPTARENGTPLAITEIGNYTLQWACNTGKTGIMTIPGSALSTIVDTADIWGQCHFTMATTDINKLVSRKSDPLEIVIRLPRPQQGGIR